VIGQCSLQGVTNSARVQRGEIDEFKVGGLSLDWLDKTAFKWRLGWRWFTHYISLILKHCALIGSLILYSYLGGWQDVRCDVAHEWWRQTDFFHPCLIISSINFFFFFVIWSLDAYIVLLKCVFFFILAHFKNKYLK